MSEVSIQTKVKSLVLGDRARDIRFEADMRSEYCLHASMYEMAAYLGSVNIPYLEGALEKVPKMFPDFKPGHTPPEHTLTTLNTMAKELNLRISRILINSGFLEISNIPEELKDVIQTADEGMNIVSYPHLRILLYEINNDTYQAHVESDFNIPYTDNRIKKLEEKGWKNQAVVEFKSI